MAQENNKLDMSRLARPVESLRTEPTLGAPGLSASGESQGPNDPPFSASGPPSLLPPPIPGASQPEMSAAPPATDRQPPAPPPSPPLPAAELPPPPPEHSAPPSPAPASDLLDEPHSTSELPPPPPGAVPIDDEAADGETADGAESPRRRMARRRAAGPSRNRIAANDDGPSIGGLIYALQQKPSNAPFKFAGIASIIWAAAGIAFALVSMGTNPDGLSWLEMVTRPAAFLTLAAIVVPVAFLWLLALLAWRTEELRLRSSTMTEVAIRLAEPDRLAEQNVASLGQAVRRQVGFMNDAISRALGRAGELEAMVHNEVAVLERSYEENERKIRGLISELSGERHALVNTSDRVSESLMRLGSEIPSLIDKLSEQQVKLSKVIEGAGENLTVLEGSLATSVGNLESAVGGRTEQLQGVLETYTTALAGALTSRTEQLQTTFDEQFQQLDSSLSSRTENLQTVFEEYARALDAALANRAQALDYQLVERTRSLDEAFGERLRLFDESIMRSTEAIDSAVVDKTQALTAALEVHAASFRETIGKQATDLDDALMHGINSVRRASENITRQSMKAMEGLANQSDMLKNISENLLNQIGAVTGRFEVQGSQIMKAANALESANFKIDKTLQNRHTELSQTLDRLAGKADEFSSFVGDYSTTIAGSLTEADSRVRGELQRLRAETEAESERTLEDLRHRLTTVSSTMTSQLGDLSERFTSTSDEMRDRATQVADDIAQEQARLRAQMERLPITTQESSEGMRRALQDQIRALDQLSHLASRTAAHRDVTPPPQMAHAEPVHAASMQHMAPPQPQPQPQPRQAPAQPGRTLTSLSSTIAQELGSRQRRAAPDNRENWSLGDLLARASLEEEQHAAPSGQHAPGPGGPMGSGHDSAARHQQVPAFSLDLAAIARALDPATAAAIWQRVRSGQRGVMVRSIYGSEGRALFDDVSHRCRNDAELSRTVNRYLSDFERIISDSDMRDPSGRLAHSQLVSDTGRVYLFLAHASGRLG